MYDRATRFPQSRFWKMKPHDTLAYLVSQYPTTNHTYLYA